MKYYYQKNEDGNIIAIWTESNIGENTGIEIIEPNENGYILLDSLMRSNYKEQSEGAIVERTEAEKDGDHVPDNRSGSQILMDALEKFPEAEQMVLIGVFEKYNSFGRFLDARNFPFAISRLDAALAAQEITQAQYDIIRAEIPY